MASCRESGELESEWEIIHQIYVTLSWSDLQSPKDESVLVASQLQQTRTMKLLEHFPFPTSQQQAISRCRKWKACRIFRRVCNFPESSEIGKTCFVYRLAFLFRLSSFALWDETFLSKGILPVIVVFCEFRWKVVYIQMFTEMKGEEQTENARKEMSIIPSRKLELKINLMSLQIKRHKFNSFYEHLFERRGKHIFATYIVEHSLYVCIKPFSTF